MRKPSASAALTPVASWSKHARLVQVSATSDAASPRDACGQSITEGPCGPRITLPGCRSRWTTVSPGTGPVRSPGGAGIRCRRWWRSASSRACRARRQGWCSRSASIVGPGIRSSSSSPRPTRCTRGTGNPARRTWVMISASSCTGRPSRILRRTRSVPTAWMVASLPAATWGPRTGRESDVMVMSPPGRRPGRRMRPRWGCGVATPRLLRRRRRRWRRRRGPTAGRTVRTPSPRAARRSACHRR